MYALNNYDKGEFISKKISLGPLARIPHCA